MEAAGITPGGPPMSEEDWTKLIRSWLPEPADKRLRQITWPEIDQHGERSMLCIRQPGSHFAEMAAAAGMSYDEFIRRSWPSRRL
ncbi:hypothetical protein [Streptomyces sp. NPDC002851]